MAKWEPGERQKKEFSTNSFQSVNKGLFKVYILASMFSTLKLSKEKSLL